MDMEKLIRDSQMDESDKEMFIELLPVMTNAHKFRLRTIIETENAKLEELEKKYGKLMMDEEKVKFRQIELVRLTA